MYFTKAAPEAVSAFHHSSIISERALSTFRPNTVYQMLMSLAIGRFSVMLLVLIHRIVDWPGKFTVWAAVKYFLHH